MSLDAELAFFEANRADLFAKDPYKFVVVKDQAVAGAFDTPDAAYEWALSSFGPDGFLIRQVLRSEPVAQAPAIYTGLVSLPR